MRKIDMRMEEIRRRSEKIRSRRKKQIRIAAMCVPVLFCIGLYAASVNLPRKEEKPLSAGLGPMGITNGTITGGFSSDDITEERTLNVNRIEISFQGVSKSISDSEHIHSVVNALGTFVAITDDSKYSLPVTDRDISVSPAESECRSESAENYGTADSALPGYSIVLYMRDGTVTVYSLDGNRLCVVGAQKTVLLSNEQLEELKQILEMHLP